jgi:uncharacterized membrane protein YdjX (TVP38/TMEM64 family)
MDKTTTLGGLFAHARTRTILTYVATGLPLIAAAILAGHDIARHAVEVEAWIAQLGPWGALAFAGLFVVATSLLLPETLLSIMAGALFGLVWGFLAVLAGTLLAATLQYALSRWMLRATIQRMLAMRLSLAAIQNAVMKNELKLQLLLRLTPLNPATISYVLGTAGVRFPGFLLACLALIPSTLIEVYFGYAGKHVAHMAGRTTRDVYLHDFIVFAGLAATIIVVVIVSRMAHKAVMDAVAATPAKNVASARE